MRVRVQMIRGAMIDGKPVRGEEQLGDGKKRPGEIREVSQAVAASLVSAKKARVLEIIREKGESSRRGARAEAAVDESGERATNGSPRGRSRG